MGFLSMMFGISNGFITHPFSLIEVGIGVGINQILILFEQIRI